MSESEIRFLVESYYDIQKLRVETFNRIVAYIKSNVEKFSQIEHETHRRYASQGIIETQNDHAGRSQYTAESQDISASHYVPETHDRSASQKTFETQMGYAGKVRPSTIAHLIVSGKLEAPKEIESLVWYFQSLYETEKRLAKRLDEWSQNYPIRTKFLDKIQGIGGILASAIIAWLSPINRFPNISKLWAYCGLAPYQKRRRGEKVNYNPKLKTLMWKIASSFEKQKPEKSHYKRIYVEKKEYLLKRGDLQEPIRKGVRGARLHVRLLAMRFTVKRFLADLWIQWRKLEGLPTTKPYAHTIMGHTKYEEWTPDKE